MKGGTCAPAAPHVAREASRDADRDAALTPGLRRQSIQVLLDLVTVFGASMAAYGLYLASGLGRGHFSPLLYLQINLAHSVITVFALHSYGEYRKTLGLLRIESIRRIILAVLFGVLLVLILSFLLKIPAYSRLTILLVGFATVMALSVQRFLIWYHHDRSGSLPRTSVLVYGAGETGRLLAQRLLSEHQLGLHPVAFLDDDIGLRGQRIKIGPGVEGRRVPVLGGEADLESAIQETGAGAVFLAMPSAASKRIANLVAAIESNEIQYYCVPSAGDLLFSALQFGQVAGVPVFSRRKPQADPVYEFAKRMFDLLCGGILLFLSLPLIALSALLIRLTSTGPVFFTQSRVGRQGRDFTIYKLRTMHVRTDRYGLHPNNPADARVTKIGYWLRRYSIDELPQLFNVLLGDMSLVGPRPEMPFVIEQYNDIQQLRLSVKPGLTGLWQISADRAFSIHKNIQYDLYYVERRGFALDLAILLYTPFILLARDRAM